MKINKKTIIGVTWFVFLIFILLFLIIVRFNKANSSTTAYEKSLEKLETEYQQSFNNYSTLNDSVLNQEIIKDEWLEKINTVDNTLIELSAENNKLETDIESQNRLTNELEQELILVENDEVNPYQINFSLNNGNNIQLIRNIAELKELGITSVADFSSPNPLTSLTLDVILKREKNFYEKSLSSNYAVIEGFYNNHKNDLFMDGNVILQITRDSHFPLAYKTLILDDLSEEVVFDELF